MIYRIAIEAVLGLLLALYVFRFARAYPQLLLQAMVVIAVLTTGWMQGPGYVLFDELFLLGLVFGVAFSPIGDFFDLKQWQINCFSSARLFLPAILLCYLALHGLYGILSFHDWRLTRWPVLYAALLGAFVLLRLRFFENGSRHYCISPVFLARISVIYFGAYLLHWIILEVMLDLRWEVFQAVSWSGSAYAMFPVVLALPLVLILLKSDGQAGHYLAYSLISLISLCAQLYSSRAAFIALLVMVAISFVHLPWRRTVMCLILVFIIQYGALSLIGGINSAPGDGTISSRMSLNYSRTKSIIGEHVMMVFETVGMPFAPRASDSDRHAHIIGTIRALSQTDLTRQLFGYGQERHKIELMKFPEVRLFAGQRQERVRSTALTAFAINHGLIGIGLFCLVCISAMKELLQAASVSWVSTLPFYAMAMAWSMVTDYRDNVLVYLVLVFNVLAMISPGDADHFIKKQRINA